MKQSIQLGPLTLPYELLVLLAAAALGVFIAKRLSRRLDVDIEPTIWRLLLVAVVIARLAFVYEYRVGYLESPLDIVDIRDGGWDPQTGIIAAWLYALLSIKRIPGLRKPLLAALAATSVIWGTGSMALAFGRHDGTPLSTVSVPTFDGQAASLADYKGKPTVVNLWATWCPPCQHELPLLQRAQAEHPEVNFVFLNQGESAEKVQGFLAARGFKLSNVLLDLKGQAGAEFGSGALPTTVLFDAKGQLVNSHIGELSRGTLAESLGKLGVTGSPAK